MTGLRGDRTKTLTMNPTKSVKLREQLAWHKLFLASMVISLATPAGLAQQTTLSDAPAAKEEEKPLVLSPFIVEAESTSGYRATNSTSGTRLSTPIRDVPMSIEVITSQFIRDTGSTSLREALRYSAGVVQNSQVDGLVNPGSYDSLSTAGSNDPGGATRNANQTTFKIRGLLVDQVLRDGFSRQAFSDTVNIDRVEVLRGPSALLYGVGNFGGIVNYIQKRPEDKPFATIGAEMGSYGHQRFELDVNQPLGKGVNFRLMGSFQENGNFTDLYKNKVEFIAPVFSFRPWENTLITVDNEWGNNHISGDGFQSVRMVDVSNGSEANSRRADFLGGGIVDLRTFRWSGPDTFHDTKVSNHLVTVDQKISENMHLRVGAQRSYTKRGSQQVTNAHINGTSPPFDRNNSAHFVNGQFLGDILYRRFVYTQIGVDPTDTQAQYYLPPTNTAVMQYQWSNVDDDEVRDQIRAELNYKLEKWGKHNLLVGYSFQRASLDQLVRSNPRSSNTRGSLSRTEIYNYRAIDDFGYFSYQKQGAGLQSLPVVPLDGTDATNWNSGAYAIYQGSLFNDRVNIIGGVRRDRTDAKNATIAYDSGTNPQWVTQAKPVDGPLFKNSPQVGVSFKVLPQLSVYGVYSTGVVPNYYLTDGAGVPLAPTQSKNKEIGLKFELMEGRLSGTISAYKVTRTGTPRYIWWAPNNVRAANNYDPNLPLAFAVYGLTTPFYNEIKDKPYMQVLDPNNQAATGYLGFKVTGPGTPGAQLLDDMLAFQSKSYLNWPGWIFDSGYDQTMSDGSGTARLNAPGSNNANGGANVPIDDENKGYEAQIVYSPTNNWQIVASYAHNENKMTSAYKYVKAPYVFGSQWAIWNFPTYGWGTFVGLPASEAYDDPEDSSTFKGIGVGTGQSLDGSPEHIVSLWNRYDFRDVQGLKGLVVGIGGTWQSREKWTNGYATDGTWIAVPDGQGGLKSLIQYTDPKLTLNLMAEYTFNVGQRNRMSVRLNVDNVLDDQSRYGLVYAPGISYRLNARFSF